MVENMIRKLLTLLVLSAFAFSVAACSEEQRALHKAPGKYESSRTSTDKYGTTRETKKSTRVDREDDGTKRAVIEEEETRDPEGLFNKKTVKKSKKVAEDKDDE